MSSMVQFYGREFRRQLRYHPVWQPGSAVVPGDFGRLEDGVFVREGFVTEVARTASPKVADFELDGPWKFSAGVKVGGGGIAEAKLSPAVKVQASLTFASEGGVVVHAQHLVQSRIENLQEVFRAIPWGTDAWDSGRVLVSEVFRAREAAVVLAESGGGTLGVSGKAKALEVLDLADASVDFGVSSAASYALRLRKGPKTHPVALRLYQASRSWFSSRPELLSVSKKPGGSKTQDGRTPWEELSPLALDD